jgi:hypothetical protein
VTVEAVAENGLVFGVGVKRKKHFYQGKARTEARCTTFRIIGRGAKSQYNPFSAVEVYYIYDQVFFLG